MKPVNGAGLNELSAGSELLRPQRVRRLEGQPHETATATHTNDSVSLQSGVGAAERPVETRTTGEPKVLNEAEAGSLTVAELPPGQLESPSGTDRWLNADGTITEFDSGSGMLRAMENPAPLHSAPGIPIQLEAPPGVDRWLNPDGTVTESDSSGMLRVLY